MSKIETKATKVRRYRAIDGGMEFLMPNGTWTALAFDDMAAKSRDGCTFYGAGQKWQDAVYAVGKDESPSMERAQEILAAFTDGTLWDRTRSATGGRPTMESTAVAIVAGKYPKLPRKDDEFKSKVAALLDPEADAKRYGLVKAEYERRVKAWEEAQGIKVAIEI